MNRTGKIDYIEFPSTNIETTKKFFSDAFEWSFVDYGSDYVAIQNAGMNGGFYKSENIATTNNGSVLVVLYSSNLEETLNKVKICGGTVVREIFSFPGGRRFHFADPNGNEYAVWSE